MTDQAFLIPVILIAAAVLSAVIALGGILTKRLNRDAAKESDVAGRRGEEIATGVIVKILREGDRLLTNVPVTYEGKTTELDNVVVNRNGVFIIEVKNYSGRLEGSENDFNWTKYHRSKGGRVYVKIVKNPLRQVKRQVFILGHFLRENDLPVWVNGYVLLLEDNAPVNSRMLLRSPDEIDRAIHRDGAKGGLDLRSTRLVVHLLENGSLPK